MAGIYHNATLGLISLSSDGSNWITIADKNLGATQVYNDGDTLSEANCGKYYQRGNNYGFPRTGSVSTGSTKVNASTYGPNNYYSSSTFIISDTWDSSNNANLWGNTTNTSVARKGPCDTGYHIASLSEMQSLIDLGIAIGAWTSTGISAISSKILLPLGGMRTATSGGAYEQGTMAYYWTSTPTNSSGSEYTRAVVLDSLFSGSVGTIRKCYGGMIRPFKNEAVIPYADEGWTKLYGDDLPPRPIQLPKLKWLVNKGNYYYFGDAPVHASGISLDKSNITLTTAGQTEQLTATVSPADAINKKVIWSSSDTSVATVSNTGLVTCVTPGSATITATCVDGGASASCSVQNTKTFTISWTEKENMSTGWTYSDDAEGLTAGDGAFDDFFGYSAVLLNTSGVETAEMTQSGGVFEDTMTNFIGNSTDNVMIKFPVRGIKMSKSGSTVTLSITSEQNKAGYQYYAHSIGTLSNPGTPKDAFYLGTYKAYNNSSVLKSWSGKTPTGNQTQATFCTQAKANGSGYNIIGFYQRQYINALYMMKYGNPNSQSVVGQGYVGGSSAPTTGGTNSQTKATYGTTGTTTQVKLFGLEDRWGGIYEWVGGTYTDGNQQLCTMLSDWAGDISGGEGTGIYISHTSSKNFDLSSIAGDNKAMFAPLATVNNSSYSTYYTDTAYADYRRLNRSGGYRGEGNGAGVFYISYDYDQNFYSTFVSSRLMFL